MTQRASRQDIFEQLTRLVGPDSVTVISTVVVHYERGEEAKALRLLAEFDKTIGGKMGVYSYVESERLSYDYTERPIYRPFQYIYSCLNQSEPAHFTRHIVNTSCLHIEGILKTAVQLNFIDRLLNRLERLPMGSLLHRKEFKSVVPPALYDDLLWLNDSIYRFGKHTFSEQVVKEELDASLFSLDEALAVYLIARHLGAELLSSMVT